MKECVCVWSSSEPNTLVGAEGHDGATGELGLLFQNLLLVIPDWRFTGRWLP